MSIECIKKEITKGKSFPVIRVLSVFLIGGASGKSVFLYRLAVFFNQKKMKLISNFINRRIEKTYGIYINVDAQISPGLSLPHPVGIVIGQGVKIDENVVIYQNVTLGGARRGDWKAKNYPSIGSDTVIFSGAVIVGKVSIGKNCVIGANAVVTKDVPDNATAVGVPAKIIIEEV